MSLEITSSPFEVAMSKNPMWFELKSPNYLSGENVYPYLELRILGKITAGQYFEFQYLDPDTEQPITVRFDAVANYDESGTEIPDTAFVGTLSEYLDEITRLLKKNPLINMYYTVTTDSSQLIYLTARQPIANLIPTDIDDTTPVLETVYSQYYEASTKQNYSVVCEVWMETDEIDSQNYSRIVKLVDHPDSNGEVSFNVQSAIHAELKESFSEPPLPDLLNDVVYVNPLIRKYYVRFAEVSGSDSTATQWHYSKIKLAYFGGVSEEDFAKANPFLWLQVKQRFLSWHENSKRVHYEQKDWVSWCNHTNEDRDVRVTGKIYYKNNSFQAFTIDAGPIALIKWGVITIPIGYEQLGIAAIAGANVPYKWDIFVEDHSTLDLLGTMTIYLDDTYEECGREIIYLNSYSCPESIFTKNGWSKQLSTSFAKSSKSLVHAYSVVNGDQFRFNNIAENSYKVESGYLTEKVMELTQDMLINSDCFILEENIFIPALIDTKSFEVSDCLTHLKELNFVLIRCFNMSSYSKLSNIPVFIPLYSCGLVGFRVEGNGLKLDDASMGDLTITNSDESYTETVSWDNVQQEYTITDIIEEFLYTVEANVVDVNGNNYPFVFDIEYENQHFFVKTKSSGYTSISLKVLTDSASIDGFINWGELSDVGVTYNTSNTQSHTYTSTTGVKIIQGQLPCIDDVITFYANSQDITYINVSKLINLVNLDCPDCFIEGELVVDNLRSLELINFQNNSLSNIKIGFMKGLATINLLNNNIDTIEVEELLKTIWEFRKLYDDASSIVITLTGNPGVSTLSDLTSDIINGTGAYDGEGLVADYSMTITVV